MISIIIAGCAGRMGKRILDCALKHPEIQVSGLWEAANHPSVGERIAECVVGGSLGDIIDDGEVIIDFTSPQATLSNVKEAVSKKKKMVIGTTGLTDSDKQQIENAAKKIPIVCAPNMSVGVNLLFKLSRRVSEVLNDEYDIEIIEAHHKHKKDAPSGTAKELARQVAQGRGVDLNAVAVYGREGICGERTKGSIGIHAVRGGDVVGEHTVSFMTEGERFELIHKASSRDTFAKGALVAALFVSKKDTGLYTMQDVLGLT